MAAPAQAGGLRAGIARVDITPPTGYYMMGWVRSDAKPIGVWTRLYARVIVLERDGHKVALVAEDLNGIPGGMLEQAARLDADRGFSERNVLDSASHTHAGPAGFYNFSTYNTVFMSVHSLTDFNLSGELDPQLYGFMVHRLALAIRRADDDASATRVVEQALRRAGAPDAVNVYGNSDEGDVSAGIAHNGPAWADQVGRIEAAAMLRAWRGAAGSVTRTPEIDLRWTRVCF